MNYIIRLKTNTEEFYIQKCTQKQQMYNKVYDINEATVFNFIHEAIKFYSKVLPAINLEIEDKNTKVFLDVVNISRQGTSVEIPNMFP